MSKAHIKVFVTKKMKFRASIKEHGSSISYEVTVGGKNWTEGKGREYEKEIIDKCKGIIKTLEKQL